MSDVQAVWAIVGVSLFIGVGIPGIIVTFWDNKDRPYGRNVWDRFMYWSIMAIAVAAMAWAVAFFILVFKELR